MSTSTRASGSRTTTIARGALVGLLAFFFLTAGAPKLLGMESPAATAEDFERWGYPAWFRPVIGAAEVLGAVALFLPRPLVAGAAPRFWASAGLAVDMVGATATHLVHGEGSSAALPFVLLVLTGVLALVSRPARTVGPSRAPPDPSDG